MEYTQRENIINNLREAMDVPSAKKEEPQSHFDAGTGTLYLLNNKSEQSAVENAISYFKLKQINATEAEKMHYDLAISCITQVSKEAE